MGSRTLEVKIKVSQATASDSYESELPLDLNQLMVRHPAATYFVRVESNGLDDLNIYSGDILVVDRSLELYEKRIVVGVLDGEFVVRKIGLEKHTDFTVWGVITYIIHKV